MVDVVDVNSLDATETKGEAVTGNPESPSPCLNYEQICEQRRQTDLIEGKNTIDVECKNGKRLPLQKRAVFQSKLLQAQFETLQPDETYLHASNADEETMARVIRYLHYHHDKPSIEIQKPFAHTEMVQIVSMFDAAFVDETVHEDGKDARDRYGELMDLCSAADYLGITPLVDICSAKVAADWNKDVQTMNPDCLNNLRRRWGFKQDLTVEEERKILDKNEWALGFKLNPAPADLREARDMILFPELPDVVIPDDDELGKDEGNTTENTGNVLKDDAAMINN